jgi:hypothetical protein
MTNVTVHQFKQYNAGTDRVIISVYKMTGEAIAAIGAEIIADTAEDVRETALDGAGRYYPGS